MSESLLSIRFLSTDVNGTELWWKDADLRPTPVVVTPINRLRLSGICPAVIRPLTPPLELTCRSDFKPWNSAGFKHAVNCLRAAGIRTTYTTNKKYPNMELSRQKNNWAKKLMDLITARYPMDQVNPRRSRNMAAFFSWLFTFFVFFSLVTLPGAVLVRRVRTRT